MKIDVAVPSYKKPESLLYTLMTLKKVAGDLIDAVYINDDCSNDGSVEIYNDRRVREYFSPWKLNVRVNTRNVHISQVYVPGYRVDYMDWKFMLTKWHRFIISEGFCRQSEFGCCRRFRTVLALPFCGGLQPEENHVRLSAVPLVAVDADGGRTGGFQSGQWLYASLPHQ